MREFGKYSIIAPIASGGMAEVYLAKSLGAAGLEKRLVLKRILPEFASRPKFVTMFIDEAKVAVSLNHPNIVQVYEFGKTDKGYYLAMEFVDGSDLGRILSACRKSSRRLSLGDLTYVAVEVAKALDYAHRKLDEYGQPMSIVHRDVSPQNILVAWDGSVRLVDFGIAKARFTSDEQQGMVKGKMSYMAPEQALAQSVDQRTDVFSLGAVLYEMIAGRAPFPRGKPEEVLTLVRAAVIPEISSLRQDVPLALRQIVMKAVARDPDDRYGSAREMQLDLMKYLFSLEQIHDAGSLSDLLCEVKPSLSGQDGSSTAARGDSTVATAEEPATFGTMGTLQEVMGPGVRDHEVTGQMLTPAPLSGGSFRERRSTFVIVGDFLGMSELKTELGEEKWQSVLTDVVHVVQSVAFKNQCAVETVDERGFLFLTGIPVSSEDDAETATRVAQDLIEAIDAMSVNLVQALHLSVGIGFGSLIIERTEINGREHHSWSATDDSWEKSRAMAKEAMAGEILVDEVTYRRTRRMYEFSELSDSELDPPLVSYRLDGSKSLRQRLLEKRKSFTTLHGREYELRLLRQSYQSTKQRGKVHIVLLLGDQGVGKASIIEDFLSGLSEERCHIIRATCSPDQRDRPFGLVVSMLEDYLDVEETRDIRRLKRWIEGRVDQLLGQYDEEERRYITHSLALLFNIKYPGNLVESLDSDRRRARMNLSLKRLFGTAARKGSAVLFVNDIHWADQSSEQLLVELARDRRPRPILFVFTGRTRADLAESRPLQQLLKSRYAVVETVEDLSPEAARALIRDLLSTPMESALLDQVVEHSGGNPLFIKEILEHIEESGLLVERRGELMLRPDVRELEIPSTVEGIVEGRIGRLPSEAKMVLQRASLMGREVMPEQLRAVLGEEPKEALRTLVESGLMEILEEGTQQERYRIKQGLTWRVAMRALVEAERLEIHTRMAEYLIDREADLSRIDLVAVAKHLEAAGSGEDSAQYYLLAANRALNTSGLAEALSLVERSTSLLGRGSEYRFSALEMKERILKDLGRTKQRRELLEELEEFVKEHGPVEHEVQVLNRLARYEYDMGSMESARKYSRRALELAEEYQDVRGKAVALTLLGTVSLNTGDEKESWLLASCALELYSQIEYPEGAAMAWNLHGILNHQRGRLEEALSSYGQAVELARRVGLRSIEEMARINIGFCLVKQGNYEKAHETYRQVLRGILRLGHRRNEAALLANLGHVQVLLGDYERADNTLKRCIRLSRRSLDVMRTADGLLTLATAELARGRLEEAQKSLRPGLLAAKESGDSYLICHGHLLSAELKMRRRQRGDLESALDELELVLSLGESTQHLFARVRGESLKASCLLRLDRRAEAMESSLRSVVALSEGLVEESEEIWYLHAQQMDELGREEEARKAIGESLRVLNEKRDRIENPQLREKYMDVRGNRRIVEMWKRYGVNES